MRRRISKKPLISVVMPVYNAGDFLAEAVRSILNQSYRRLELIMVNDASTDNSWKIMESFAKRSKRIKIFRNKKNMGVSETVKKAISKAKGDYIARMDADDIAFPNRLKKQLTYLLAHKNVVAVGGQCRLIDKEGQLIGKKEFPLKAQEVYDYSFKFVPVQQPTLMIDRKRLPVDFQFYRDGMNTAEEVELFFKLFQYGKIENLPDFVLKYRLHSHNLSLKNLKQTFILTFYSRLKAVFAYGYRPTPEGILSTLGQALIVVFLPSQVILWIYKKIRKFHLSEVNLKQGFSFRLSFQK